MVENECLIVLLSLPDIVLFGYNFMTLLLQFHVTITKRYTCLALNKGTSYYSPILPVPLALFPTVSVFSCSYSLSFQLLRHKRHSIYRL